MSVCVPTFAVSLLCSVVLVVLNDELNWKLNRTLSGCRCAVPRARHGAAAASQTGSVVVVTVTLRWTPFQSVADLGTTVTKGRV